MSKKLIFLILILIYILSLKHKNDYENNFDKDYLDAYDLQKIASNIDGSCNDGFTGEYCLDEIWIIDYSHKYENRNGRENEHNERIVIDHDGNERRHMLPNRYLHH